MQPPTQGGGRRVCRFPLDCNDFCSDLDSGHPSGVGRGWCDRPPRETLSGVRGPLGVNSSEVSSRSVFYILSEPHDAESRKVRGQPLPLTRTRYLKRMVSTQKEGTGSLGQAARKRDSRNSSP